MKLEGIVVIENRMLSTLDRAYLRPDNEQWVAVQWLESDGSEDHLAGRWIDCWAWVEDDILFLPSDGQSLDGRLEGDTPDPNAGWYSPVYGKMAIFGIPGGTMAIII